MPFQKQFEVNLTPDDLGEPYIAMLGADGRRISSRDKIMRCTDTIIGSLNYSARTPPVQQINTSKIADCHPSATFVWGYAKITNQGSGEWSPMPSDAWLNIGGTYLQIYLWQIAGGERWCDGFAGYSFYASAGELFVEERLTADRIYLNDYGQFSNYPSFTLNYHLWCCAFD